MLYARNWVRIYVHAPQRPGFSRMASRLTPIVYELGFGYNLAM